LRAQRVRLPGHQELAIAEERGAPAGVKPVVWRLVTNREAHDLDAVIELIDWYRARWEIEMFSHVLKNACKVEALHLSHMGHVERALVLYMVVRGRVALPMRLGRTCPDPDASLFFDADEIRGAYLLEEASPCRAAHAHSDDSPDCFTGRLPGQQGRWRSGCQDAPDRTAANHGCCRYDSGSPQ
jgi:hypothetical protein